jgi:peroxiredoxin
MNSGCGCIVRSMREGLLPLGAAIIAFVGAGWLEPTPVHGDQGRQLAPDFALKDAGGRTVRLSDYRGKVVLLDFWATWCGGCRTEVPWFTEFQRDYGSRGFTVVGVSMDNDDGWSVVKPFVAQRQINYPILLGNDGTAQLYGGLNALPVALLVDRDGRIAATHVGTGAGKDGFRREIEGLLDPQRAGQRK